MSNKLLSRLNTVNMLATIITSITEQCSLLLPLLWGAGPMALMLWLDGMMMMMMNMLATVAVHTISICTKVASFATRREDLLQIPQPCPAHHHTLSSHQPQANQHLQQG
jgi:hypothetical protein